MLQGIRKKEFKQSRRVHFSLPLEMTKMSRQQSLTMSFLKDQCQPQFTIVPPRSRSLKGYIISLDEDRVQNLPTKTCVHIADKNDELVVHIRNFRNGLPTSKGVAYDHAGWKALTDLLPTLDMCVKGFHGLQKVLFAFDSQRSVTIMNGGQTNVQVIFQWEDKHIVLTPAQWLNLVGQAGYIRMKIVEHMAGVIARVEAQT